MDMVLYLEYDLDYPELAVNFFFAKQSRLNFYSLNQVLQMI
jgi:hypothetical protein